MKSAWLYSILVIRVACIYSRLLTAAYRIARDDAESIYCSCGGLVREWFSKDRETGGKWPFVRYVGAGDFNEDIVQVSGDGKSRYNTLRRL
jgi:hypothetical protein